MNTYDKKEFTLHGAMDYNKLHSFFTTNYLNILPEKIKGLNRLGC